MHSYDAKDLSIIEDVHDPSKDTSDVNALVVSITLILDEVYVHENIVHIHDINGSRIIKDVHVSFGGTSDFDVLVDFSTHMLDEVYVHKNGNSDIEHVLVEYSMLVQGVRWSLVKPRIDKVIEYGIAATNGSNSEPLEFLQFVRSPSVFSSKFLKFFFSSEVCQVLIKLNVVMLVEVFDKLLYRTYISRSFPTRSYI